MRFPDVVTILRAAGEDEYGNVGSWQTPDTFTTKGFLTYPEEGATLLLPKTADIRGGDRVQVDGKLFEVVPAGPRAIRSPSNPLIMWNVSLTRLPDGA